MRKDLVLKTNVFVCFIIIIGFIITSIISYYSNMGIYKEDVERVSMLSSEGIFHQIDSIFTKPINISLTMANDSLLKEFLAEEMERLQDEEFIQKMKSYLLAYQEKYAYDSVFLVSARTSRYYHFNGLDRILTPDNEENVWYYSFLNSCNEYEVVIDNDEAENANNEITIFVNCKIKNTDGATMGVVGVGFGVTHIQELLKEYETQYGVLACLVDENGMIEVSTEQTGYQKVDFFQNGIDSNIKSQIFSKQETAQSRWYATQEAKGFLVSRYVPNLGWYIMINNDTSVLEKGLELQFFSGMVVICIVMTLVILTITSIIRKFNHTIVELTIAKEQRHRTIFQEATEKMYENIYEMDITHNHAASESTEVYFESLGVPKDTPFDQALPIIAEKQIKEEFRQGYIETFSPANVLKTYENGGDSLRYDFMISTDGENYYWMRITARIFYWAEDESIRMFVYRQNIDIEKQQERKMLEQMEKDSLSNLYNKATTQNRIRELLEEGPDRLYGFFMLDIDNFKLINDTYGHATGDIAIATFGKALKRQFRETDIVGRVGGDEFIVFVPIPDKEWANEKAKSLVAALQDGYVFGGQECQITTSIGVAIAPEAGADFETLYQNADFALYQTKRRGKNGFTVYTRPQ